MSKQSASFSIEIESTDLVCPTGERTANQYLSEKRIPVITCEGGCIRGEIARLAANIVVKEGPYRRACHGEMFTAPHSAMARWAKEASNVVVIDGCFMRCHGRISKNLFEDGKVIEFDALSIYNKYTDLIDIDDVSEAERKVVARQVADKVLADLK